MTSIVTDLLWRSTPTIIRPISLSPPRIKRYRSARRGRATWSCGQSPLSHNLTTALDEKAARSWTARAGGDPAADLRETLATVFATVAARLRPEVAVLEAAV